MPASDPLSFDRATSSFCLGAATLRYRLHKSGGVEFLPVPAAHACDIVERSPSRPSHPTFSGKNHGATWACFEPDPLVQVAVRGLPLPKNWVAGGTMRNHAAAQSLRFSEQTIEETAEGTVITTCLTSEHGFAVCHIVDWRTGDAGFLVRTAFTNASETPLTLEMLSSFSLAGLTPFATDDAPNRLRLHRFRSAWSAEGRHEDLSFEEAHLERTWGAGPVFLRFGQTGSLPVRGFFPFVAVEDREAGVLWGAQVAWHGSWQMEVYRRDDNVALSGGLGDFEQAQWAKEIAPGETFHAPTALLATTTGDIETLCQSLVALQSRIARPEPEQERDLPIIFNEWCSTWGKPTHDYAVRTADRLAQTPTKYLVIDDGWAEKPKGADIQFNGDWNVNEDAFSGGIAKTTAAIRERGLIPGIWFEFEPCTEGTEAYRQTSHQLHLHGKVLQVGNRHFWDFRDPWTFDYLTRKVIDLLRDNGFGYLKVDYNESIGIGCDGAESLGEGLRQHLVKVKEFFEKIRREVPGIVIENCASGGHRLEPGMIGVTSMSSFSDAHETVEIPIIAANLHRLIPAHKNQVWAVLRPEDSPQRLRYSLAATFLGRMCISGDVVNLSEDRFTILKEAQEFYQSLVPVIRDGRSRITRAGGTSMRYPTGWQAVVRHTADTALVVLHAFDQPPSEPLRVALPKGAWSLATAFSSATASIEGVTLVTPPPPPFTGAAWLLKNDPPDPSDLP